MSDLEGSVKTGRRPPLTGRDAAYSDRGFGLLGRRFTKLPRLPTGGRLQKGGSGKEGGGGCGEEGRGGTGAGSAAEAASRMSSGVTTAGTGRPGLRSFFFFFFFFFFF